MGIVCFIAAVDIIIAHVTVATAAAAVFDVVTVSAFCQTNFLGTTKLFCQDRSSERERECCDGAKNSKMCIFVWLFELQPDTDTFCPH